MKITRAGTRPSVARSDTFTGTVRMDPLNTAEPPGRVAVALVTFEPGARTHWHTHPYGQTLVIASGRGRVGREGGPVEEVTPGDVVWFDAGERHWHGAAPQVAMSHYAIQEAKDGETADWEGPVDDAAYHG